MNDERSAVPQLGEDGVTKAEFVLETGLLPREYVLRLLTEADGKLLQGEVTDHTGWSESRVSSLLVEMENAGHVVRVQFGREKVVYLPEAAPGTGLGPGSSGAD